MRLWIVRHGKAQQSSPTGADFDRPLLPRGESQARWLGEYLASRKKQPDLILTSGLARALATAKLIHEHLDCDLEVVKELETGRSVSDAIDLITARQGRGQLMLVGHNPTLAELVWVLERGLPIHEADLKTGQAVVFEFDDAFGPGKGRIHKTLRMDDAD